MKPRIGILNSGGDCAGLNGVIAGIVKTGYKDYDFVGIRRGLDGLIHEGTDLPLTREDVRGIAHLGGTILTTVNKGDFGSSKVKDGQIVPINPDILQRAKDRVAKLGLEGLVIIGGDGTLTSAAQLSQAGLNVIGVPKTIDNDLRATQRTFGFESAVEIVTEALDRIHTTATSHERIMIVEVMGRHAGWIALNSGIAGGADIILIPEIPFSYHKVAEAIRARAAKGRREAVIVVAEGAVSIEETSPVYMQQINSGESRLGGIAQRLSNYLTAEVPEFENRAVVLGHIQRGGAPTSDDRVLAFMYGAQAMNMIRQKNYGKMVTWDGAKLGNVDLMEIVDGIKNVDTQNELVQFARAAEISFGD